MSGSTEAVPALPSPPLVPTGDLPKASDEQLASREPEARRSASAISKVAWVPQAELGQAEWMATGRRLGAIGRCSQWWIGDWIRYGASRWGEKYAEAARVTGYDVASLRNMAWVASQFEVSLRSDKLTWSHHVLLAPLGPEDQKHWLDRARDERLSVADLRLELRSRNGNRKGSPGGDKDKDADETAVCPNCGHKLPERAD